MFADTYRFGGRFGLGQLSPLAMPAQSAVGVMHVAAPYAMIRTGRVRTDQLAAVSRLNATLQLNVPIGGWRWQRSLGLQLKTPAYEPPETDAQFRALCGLRPPADADEGVTAAPQSLSEAVQGETARNVKLIEARGIQVFKIATATECDNRPARLSRVIDLLTIARDHDRAGHLPTLLIAHAALEKEQMILAASSIVETVRRRPTMFHERADQEVRDRFGDPERMDEQMRRFLRASEYNETSVEAHVLSAYCAWVLGESERARGFLQQAEEISRGQPSYRGVRMVRLALEAALR